MSARWMAPLPLWAMCVMVLLSSDPVGSDGPGFLDTRPVLADVPVAVDHVQSLAKRNQLVERVRRETYDGYVEAHPLVEEAGAILAKGLLPWSGGVYVTSLVRAPEDQRRLMRRGHTRWWAIQRSKHLMGFAIDIGFVSRRVSMDTLKAKARALLNAHLGPERASKLRVVRESRCLHVEIRTTEGELLETRTDALLRAGILWRDPGAHPVPRLSDYVPETIWTQAPKRPLVALPL